MKLQELLRKCDFDRMFEYIVKFDPKSEGSRFSYLVAYELLCDMEAEGPASEISVWCSYLKGCNWQKALGAAMNFCEKKQKIRKSRKVGK
jgi:hypothetical protein